MPDSQISPMVEKHHVHEALRDRPDFSDKKGIEQFLVQLTSQGERFKLAQEVTARLRATHEHYRDMADETMYHEVEEVLEEMEEELMAVVEKARKEAIDREIEASPEKKSLLGRALGVIKSSWEFVKNHKWKILGILLLLAGVGAGWYYADYLKALFAQWGWTFGTGVEEGAAEAVTQGAEAITQGGEAIGEAAGPVSEVVGETASLLSPEEAAMAAFEAREELRPVLTVIDKQIWFDGIEYNLSDPQSKEALQTILKPFVDNIEKVREASGDLAPFRIDRHGTARYWTYEGVKSLLENMGVKPDDIYMPSELLKTAP